MKLETAKTILELIAIPFAIGYAVVTYGQWRDANRNFRIDQRPYLIVKAPGNLTPNLAPNVALHDGVTVLNGGRTPAIDSYQEAKLVYFQQPNIQQMKIERPHEYIIEAEKRFIDGEFAKLSDTEKQTRSILRPLEAEHDVAPNADLVTGDDTGLTLTQAQFDDVISIGKGNHWAGAVFLVGLITYTDGSKEPYRTEFCWYILDPGATTWERCRWHNIIR